MRHLLKGSSALLPVLLAMTAVWPSAGCGRDEASSASDQPEAETEPWNEALAEPTAQTLLRALAQPHIAVRDSLGPHRLNYVADFSLIDASGRQLQALPDLDAPVVLDQAVHDQLELVWAAPRGGHARFSLSQSNDHERGRDVVMVDGRMYSRQRHRSWVYYPVETDIHERWLDDAQRSVHDVIELATPRLRISAEPIEAAGIGEADAVAIELGLAAETRERTPRRAGVSSWPDAAEIESISGKIVLDRTTGAWLSADIDVQYALPAADGRTLRGTIRLIGGVDLLTADTAEVEKPAEAGALPERTRLQVERDEMLDGLAAPR